MKIGDKVVRKDKDLKSEGLRLSTNAIEIIKACDYTGEVTQMQDSLVYVGFRHNGAWVTQVFKPEELEIK